ncbi:hypothetical protein ACFQSB_34010 [Sphaerisporangium rhizosphaerae]|uniref:Uncharacterized protein n=1 Tax=Sphaerisporangium rhizosphaerae TaxID=2269375 RepID=A0ABW2PI08_9ACTN
MRRKRGAPPGRRLLLVALPDPEGDEWFRVRRDNAERAATG